MKPSLSYKSFFVGISTLFLGVSILFMFLFFHQTPTFAASNTVSGLNVFVGYAEDKESNTPNPAQFPTPWKDAPNTVFLGNPVTGSTNCGTLTECYDAGAIRLDNPTSSDITVSDVLVDIHSSLNGGKTFDLWGSFTVPAGKSVILTQNPPGNNPSFINFDTSGYPSNSDCSHPITVAPTITFTINGTATTLVDSTHVLDTGGVDPGVCNPPYNESIQWRTIGSTGNSQATLTLTPDTTTLLPNTPVTETATLLDGSGEGLPNAPVSFLVTSGPNKGKTGSSVTNTAGKATFSYASTTLGTDTIVARVTTVGSFNSNQTNVYWSDGSITPTPAPVQLSNLHVMDTTNASKWSLQNNLQSSAIQYGDRSYTITNFPSLLTGSPWIKTAMSSRTFTTNPLVSFTISQPVTVYVAQDTRAPQPSWMDEYWINSNQTLTDNQSAGHNTFTLFSKIFPAGTVSLGPGGDGTTGVNMYSVIVSNTQQTTSPTPTPTDTPTPTPTATPAPTPTPTSSPVQVTNLQVMDMTNASKWSLQNNLQSGVIQYGDRSYTISSFPSQFTGTSWIRTANNSRTYTANPLVTFSINQAATVYVAVDTRSTRPSWMDNTWLQTNLSLLDSQTVGSNSFVIYAKSFPSGIVSLGGGPGSTSVNMYSMIIK